MSICLTWFPIGGLGEPSIYQNMGGYTRMSGFYLEVLREGVIIVSHFETYLSHTFSSRVVQNNFASDIVNI